MDHVAGLVVVEYEDVLDNVLVLHLAVEETIVLAQVLSKPAALPLAVLVRSKEKFNLYVQHSSMATW